MVNRFKATVEVRVRRAIDSCPPTASSWCSSARFGGAGLDVEFRRQVVIADFIVDFLAAAQKLIVEVDGPYHQPTRRADARRERKLVRLAHRMLRLDAALVRRDLAQAVARIRSALL
jgi:very-short-patch-repair endonuclease